VTKSFGAKQGQIINEQIEDGKINIRALPEMNLMK
jgi:hypothetical protein